MNEKYKPPELLVDHFNCPHCEKYTSQIWFDVQDDKESKKLNKNKISISLCSECNKYALWVDKELKYPEPKTSSMPLPENNDLPFFSYGLFKPGEIAYFRIKDFVDDKKDARLRGLLKIRDGILILDIKGKEVVDGVLLEFKSKKSKKAYQQIINLEPNNQYIWKELSVEHNGGSNTANVLIGKSPNKGSSTFDEYAKNNIGWNDPFFTIALDVVEANLINNKEFKDDLETLFNLEMAYLLLWSSIERYVTLRYSLGTNTHQKVLKIAEEDGFKKALKKYVKIRNKRKGRTEIYRTDDPTKKETLNPEEPKKSVNYYYQVRSNITHRGKAILEDFHIISDSLEELLKIFNYVLNSAEKESKR